MATVTRFVPVALAIALTTLTFACTNGRLDAWTRVGGVGGGGDGGAVVTPLVYWVDDFEDGDTKAADSEGWWYTVNDESGTQSFGLEPVTDRTESKHAMRTRGEGFSIWGAALGVDLNASGAYFDASAYDEVRFWSRSAPGADTELHVAILDENGTHFGHGIELSSTWQQFRLAFADFAGPEEQPTIEGHELLDVQFFSATGASFDFVIDDVELAGSK